MAKLKTETITVENEAGLRQTERFEISVTSQGQFRALIPDHLAIDPGFTGCLLRAAKAESQAGVSIEKPQKHSYLCAPTLQAVLVTLRAGLKAFIAVEKTIERVILYAFNHQGQYALAADGSVAQNGYLAGEGYIWPKDENFSTIMREDSTSYMVAVWARVYDKVTYTRGDTVVIKFENVLGANSSDYESPAQRLNAFDTYALIPHQGSGARYSPSGNGARSDQREMPYSDEAAEFFIRLMLSMCCLAQRMRDFFADEKKLQLAIAQGSPVLGPPGLASHPLLK